MTDIQIKFLEQIYKGDKTAKELCVLLKIKGNKNDSLGGYYNALNNAIAYLTSDDGNEIDCMFIIKHDMSTPVVDDDIYHITKEGKKYIEDYRREKKNNIHNYEMQIIGIIIAILSVIVSILLVIL